MKSSQNRFKKTVLEYEYMHCICYIYIISIIYAFQLRAGSTGRDGTSVCSFFWKSTLGEEQGNSLKSACVFQRNKSISLCHCLLRKCYREEYLMQYIPIYLYLCGTLLNIKANGKRRCIRGVLWLRGRFITELSLTTERIHRLECHTITHC